MDKELHRFIGNKPFNIVMNALRNLQAKKKYKEGVPKHTFLNQVNMYGYYNHYYRAKPELLKYGFVEYNLSDKEHWITLTDKGKKFLDALDQIERIANE